MPGERLAPNGVSPLCVTAPIWKSLEEVEPLDVGDDRGLAGVVRCLQVGGGEGAAHAAARDELVDLRRVVEVVSVELAGRASTDDRQRAGGVADEERAVGHVGQANAGEAVVRAQFKPQKAHL